jgi:hypothetical protein
MNPLSLSYHRTLEETVQLPGNPIIRVIRVPNNLPSGIRHPASDIRHPTSGIRHPASGIRHPASGIRDQKMPDPEYNIK